MRWGNVMQKKMELPLRKRKNRFITNKLTVYFLGTMHLASVATTIKKKLYLKRFLSKSQVVIMEYPAGKFSLKSIFIAPIFIYSILIYSYLLELLGKLSILFLKRQADDRGSFLKFIKENGLKYKILVGNIDKIYPKTTLKIIKFNDILFGNWFSRHFIISIAINYLLIIWTSVYIINNLNIVNFILAIFFLFLFSLIIVVSITYPTRNKNITNLIVKLNSLGFKKIFILYGAGHFWDIKRRLKKLYYKINIKELKT